MESIDDVKKQAQWELDIENFERLVEAEKQRLRTKKKPWYKRYRIVIIDTQEK